MVPVRALEWVSSPPDFFDMMVLRFQRRQLHESNVSEHDLANFLETSGPSARHAFTYAADADEFEERIRDQCGSLSLSQLRDIMREAATLDLNHTLSHQVIVIAPRPDSPRSQHCVRFTSTFIANLVYAALRTKSTYEAQVFCTLFNSAMPSKGLAGNMLDKLVHSAFDQGGYLPIFEMSKSSRPGAMNWLWKTPKRTAANLFLHINSMGFSFEN